MDVELALERIEGELAAELPSHMRAFASAHAERRASPPAPAVTRQSSTLATARRAAETADVSLAARGLALLRLVVPIVIESDPAVMAARREPRSWPALARLGAARDSVARGKLGRGALEMMHWLHGVTGESAGGEVGPPIEGWHARGPEMDIDAAWRELAARYALGGQPRILRSDGAHPRAFVVESQREVIVVVPNLVETPAARFAVLHELGHAVVALGLPSGMPRVVDEAGAAYVARSMEATSALAIAARQRRSALATMLDRIERRLPDVTETPGAKPPWGLWHDPGAQAAYIEAERIADRIDGPLLPALLEFVSTGTR